MSGTNSSLSFVGLALNIGWQVAIPLVVLALLGRYVDKMFHTSPLIFLASILVAIIVSSWLVIRTVTRVIDNTTNTPENTDNTSL